MRQFRGEASTIIDADPDAVFAMITDIDRLPTWNAAIEAVTDRPDALAVGIEWTVKMHPPRMPSWGSISRVVEMDRAERRFDYETRNADGNPSSVTWTWQVRPSGSGATEVTVTWVCELRTIDRRLLAGPLRRRHLAREVPRSLDALAGVFAATD